MRPAVPILICLGFLVMAVVEWREGDIKLAVATALLGIVNLLLFI